MQVKTTNANSMTTTTTITVSSNWSSIVCLKSLKNVKSGLGGAQKVEDKLSGDRPRRVRIHHGAEDNVTTSKARRTWHARLVALIACNKSRGKQLQIAIHHNMTSDW